MKVIYGEFFQVKKQEPIQDRVQRLKEVMLTMPQYEAETKHYFHAGMYCREVFRHAGVTIVGKVHKKEHFYLIASGTVTVTTDDGMQTITGPRVLMSKPGTQRAVYAETDAVCMTFHVTDKQTPEEAEVELVELEPDCPFDALNKIKLKEVTVCHG